MYFAGKSYDKTIESFYEVTFSDYKKEGFLMIQKSLLLSYMLSILS